MYTVIVLVCHFSFTRGDSEINLLEGKCQVWWLNLLHGSMGNVFR